MPRAKHRCLDCPALVEAGVRRCDKCQPAHAKQQVQQGGSWGSNRTSSTAHKAFRDAVLTRDKRVCQLRYDGCEFIATIAGHIVPVAAGGITDAAGRNGRAECGSCSTIHTRRERAYIQHGTGEQPWPNDPTLTAPPAPSKPVGARRRRPQYDGGQVPRSIGLRY